MGKYKDKHGTTRVGDYLRSAGEVAKPILKVGAKLTGQEWLETIADGIVTSADLNEQQKNIALELLEKDMSDLHNARDTNARIQETENASWMAKNMPYIYDCFILSIWGFMTVYLLLSWIGIIQASEDVDMSGVTGIYAGVTGLATQIIAYHRGSSASSQSKNYLLARFGLGKSITKN